MKTLLLRNIVLALIFVLCIPASAADYNASIGCTGAAILTPNESIVRVKGVADTITFALQASNGVSLSVSNWKINNELIFNGNNMTVAGSGWGAFITGNNKQTLSWTLGGFKDGAFKLTAVLKRSCGTGGPGGVAGLDEEMDLWNGSVSATKVELQSAKFGNGAHPLRVDPIGVPGFTDAQAYAHPGAAPPVSDIVRNSGTGLGSNPALPVEYSAWAVCYSWESSPSISATFKLDPPPKIPGLNGTFKVTGTAIQADGSTTTLIFEKNATLVGDSATIEFSVNDTNMKFKRLVDSTSLSLTWEISFDVGENKLFTPLTTTINPLYITAGTPAGSSVTRIRVATAVTEAKGLSVEQEIVHGIWARWIGNEGKIRYMPTSPKLSGDLVWALASSEISGECIAISELFVKGVEILGITGGERSIAYIYADINKSVYESAIVDDRRVLRSAKLGNNGHSDIIGADHDDYEDSEWIGFIDRGGKGNNWQACFKYRHVPTDPYIYFSPGTGGAMYSSSSEVMNAICVGTNWSYGSAPFNRICSSPGPFPVEKWDAAKWQELFGN